MGARSKQNEQFKKIEKLSEKAIRIINFLPPLNQKTRSSSTNQLKVNNFKTERYGCKSIVNKCTLDSNNLRKILKQNFQMMKRSDFKTNIKNYFLKQHNDKKD